jgi:hypothetical protein
MLEGVITLLLVLVLVPLLLVPLLLLLLLLLAGWTEGVSLHTFG